MACVGFSDDLGVIRGRRMWNRIERGDERRGKEMVNQRGS